MLQQDMLHAVSGMDVIGSDGERIGRAGSVFLDDDTGQPEWITVETGLFGLKENFVPADQATVEGDSLRIPYDKAKVKDAPQIEPTEGHIDESEEAELYRYYGRSRMSDRTGTDAGTGGRTGRGRTAGRDADDAYARGTTDEAMTRSEERADVGVARYETGRARLRKYVETEHVTQTVPVRKERVRVETEPITDANARGAFSGPEISEGEHEVVLHEERPVVDTEAVPVERVRLEVDEEVDEVPIDVDLRKERIEVDRGSEGTSR
jgi:stress response protein YsnF